ncbi:MAG: methylenetetrahydrofolate reductase [NAD(P)H] [Vulcanibacillus sp.]
MKIKDIFSKKKPVISFEIFPPKKDSSIDTIYKTIDELIPLKPDYISVTYGAGGTLNNNKTIEIASYIKNTCNIEALAHLTSITSTKEIINKILDELSKNNIENILALRGDFPQGENIELIENLHFKYAKDLVNHINDYDDKFCVGGTCYPEGHIETRDIEKEIIYLKEKVDIGTSFLVSQLFFDNSLFYDFKERVDKKGINVPIQAGIMPVINKKQINRIATLCGASLPRKFTKIMDEYESNSEALMDAGIAYATEQIIDLLSSGIDGIHIYTMNNPEVARRISGNIASIVSALNSNKNSKNNF